jgi:sugar lactone lactonase YvrE
MSVENLLLEPISDHRCLLGEGPLWDAGRKTICWVDILNGLIHEYDPAKSKSKSLRVDHMVGSIAICSDGNILAALQPGFAFIDRATSAVSNISMPEGHPTTNRFNDGKCDPAGRFWAGTMALSEEAGAGSVYVFDRNSHIRQVMKGVSISNGMAWTTDGRTLYYIDTPTQRIVAFDYDLETGSIKNKRTAIDLRGERGFPDGMTIDQEDNLWVAHWDGWQVSRWNPRTGKKIGSITMPAARVTSCTFGGERLDELFITTARVGLTPEQQSLQPLAGSIFRLRNPGAVGRPAFEFER